MAVAAAHSIAHPDRYGPGLNCNKAAPSQIELSGFWCGPGVAGMGVGTFGWPGGGLQRFTHVDSPHGGCPAQRASLNTSYDDPSQFTFSVTTENFLPW